MYRKHGPDHVVLITQVWPLIPIDDPDFLEWKALGNEPEEQGEPELDISADLERAELVNEAYDLVMARLSTTAPVAPLGYPDEAEEVEPEEAPVIEVEPEPDGVPELFREFMLQDETTERFTLRMKNRLQALKHLQIDGTKPTNARALPDMTEEEIAELADLEARNLKSGNWLG